MAEVGVHVGEVRVVVFQGVTHGGQDGRAQPLFAGPVQDVDAGVGGSQLIGQLTRAVGGVVVDD